MEPHLIINCQDHY